MDLGTKFFEMARSNSRKDCESILWFFCESCDLHIPSKFRLNHECFKAEEYIENKILVITQTDGMLESFIDSSCKNRIGIPESTMFLCDLKIDQPVLIKSSNFQWCRRVWPLSDAHGCKVYLSPEDLVSLQQVRSSCNIVSISKLCQQILNADTLFVGLDTADNTHEKYINELILKLIVELQDNILCNGTLKILDFYNKKLQISVRDIKPVANTLNVQIANLAIENDKRSFYKVTRDTKIELDSRSSLDISKKIPHVVGLDNVHREIEILANMVLSGETFNENQKVPHTLLVFGPSGCGKTVLCEKVIKELNTKAIRINSHEIYSKFFGETENKLRQNFEAAKENFPNGTIIFIENIDSICPREEMNDTVKRASKALIDCIDTIHLYPKHKKTFLICTTSNIENLNTALRRSGRIDRELEVGVPSSEVRCQILKTHLKFLNHSLSEDQIRTVADVTHGFVGADLQSLIWRSFINAGKSENYDEIQICHVNDALNLVKPSAMREILIENPKVMWNEIGGQNEIKFKLKQAIEWPLVHQKKFQKLGIKPPTGILMFGPPGCSKTMIAKALATEAKVNFISIKGPELFSMWVGESERAVREVFRKARQVAPSIIFFDEIDAIGGRRSSASGSTVAERVLAQMLTELDGITSLNNVTILAATNRPDVIDRALLRPGRIDRLVYVGLPDKRTRQEIFSIKLKQVNLASDITLDKLSMHTDGYSGAEISAICQEAVLLALKDNIEVEVIDWAFFETAFKIIPPRTSPDLIKKYEDYLVNH